MENSPPSLSSLPRAQSSPPALPSSRQIVFSRPPVLVPSSPHPPAPFHTRCRRGQDAEQPPCIGHRVNRSSVVGDSGLSNRSAVEQARIDLIEGAAGRMAPLHEEGLLRRPRERLIHCGGIYASRIISGSGEILNDRSEAVHMWE
jgi:hypothetical protein